MIRRRLAVIFCAFLTAPLLITGCNSGQQRDTAVVTQLDTLAQTMPPTCQQVLLDTGNDLIGKKKHFLQPTNRSTDANPASNYSLSGTLHYHDRPSHIQLDLSASADSCTLRYQLSYQLDTACMVAREEAFKKWVHQGKLGDMTQYYIHKRHPNKSAYLTNISRNTQCLVNVHAIYHSQEHTTLSADD